MTTYTDELDPRAETWTRKIRPATSIIDSPRWYREIAAAESDPALAASYRELADGVERYLVMRGAIP